LYRHSLKFETQTSRDAKICRCLRHTGLFVRS
jgi:hypothetical protein